MSTHDQLAQALIHMLELSTTRSMHDWGHYVRNAGLSMPQMGLLMQLYHHGSCGVTDVSRQSGVTNAAASQLVDRLVDKHLVERIEDARDRRVKQLSLTGAGRQLVETSIRERYQWMANVAACLTVEERVKLMACLPALVRVLQESDKTIKEKKAGCAPGNNNDDQAD